ICKQLVDLMGGTIGIESKQGQGSTFFFTVTLDEATPEDVPARTGIDYDFDGTGLRALVVDDNIVACEIVENYLRAQSMDIVTLQNPLKAQSLLQQEAAAGRPFSFLILDYAMPGMDGLTLARSVNDDASISSLCKVLVTSQPGRSGIESIRAAGIDGYLSKPVRPSELTAVLKMLWQAHQAGEEHDLVTRHSIRAVSAAPISGDKNLYFHDVKILVAEDNQTNQEILTAMLTHYGIEADVVGDGRNAVKKMMTFNYDLILMDCQMPIMDGFEATRSVRREKGGQEDIIIALTANVMQGDREKCIAAGMNDYMGKPFRNDELENMLIKWLPPEKRADKAAAVPTAKAPSHENGVLDGAILDKLRLVTGDKFPVIIKTFGDNAARLMAEMAQAYNDNDAERLARAAHSLKSSAGQLGAMGLSRTAGDIEELAMAEDVAAAEALIALAREQSSRVQKELQKLS
ncbi:MAG: response regulator, partial [Alphaproteobacteria bacterium]|nr:response regulator [Alphaproteobacteria bacterium]